MTTNRNLKIAEQAALIGKHMAKFEILAGEPPACYTLNASGLSLKFVYRHGRDNGSKQGVLARSATSRARISAPRLQRKDGLVLHTR